nr:hypothetical protein CFP56_63076 [Quercus suber]
MKTFTVAAMALYATSALAAPGRGWRGGHWGQGKEDKTVTGLDQFPFDFTSTYSVVATPDQVVNGTTPTGGLPVSSNHSRTPQPASSHTDCFLQGAKGKYELGLNSDKNFICWYITLNGFRGNYQSPALTATHIHEAKKGASGTPRIAFSNPIGDEKEAISFGCQQGPFRVFNGTMQDPGFNFQVKQIEQNPSGFFADVHSSLAVPGAVRGQLA